jgi:hypothetical protein
VLYVGTIASQELYGKSNGSLRCRCLYEILNHFKDSFPSSTLRETTRRLLRGPLFRVSLPLLFIYIYKREAEPFNFILIFSVFFFFFFFN